MIIQFIVGDKYKDGHGQVEVFLVECSLSKRELEVAFKEGCRTIGVDWAKEEDEEQFSDDAAAKLREHGIVSESDWGGVFRVGTPETFLDVWMQIAAIGNDSLTWNHAPGPPSIWIGGYWATWGG